LGEIYLSAWVDRAIGIVARLSGETEEATHHAERSHTRFGEMGDQNGVGSALAELGRVALTGGDLGKAEDSFVAILNNLQRTGPERDTADNWIEAIEGLAWIASVRGDTRRTARLLASAARHRELLGVPFPSRADGASHQNRLNEVRAAVVANWARAWEDSLSLTRDQVIREALAGRTET
jgi:hypothetical protein